MNYSILFTLGLMNYGSLLFAYLMRDIILLRIFTLISGTAGILYYIYISLYGRWMWVDIFWETLFILVNLVQLIILVRNKRAIHLTDEESDIYAKYFSKNFTKEDFYKLIRLGTIMRADPGEQLVMQGEKVLRLVFLCEGAADIIVDNEDVGVCKNGNFIGEMSFISNKPASATVRISETARYIMWIQEDLKKLLAKNPELEFSLSRVLNEDLVSKLGTE